MRKLIGIGVGTLSGWAECSYCDDMGSGLCNRECQYLPVKSLKVVGIRAVSLGEVKSNFPETRSAKNRAKDAIDWWAADDIWLLITFNRCFFFSPYYRSIEVETTRLLLRSMHGAIFTGKRCPTTMLTPS